MDYAGALFRKIMVCPISIEKNSSEIDFQKGRCIKL
jgi:hypothetical protein